MSKLNQVLGNITALKKHIKTMHQGHELTYKEQQQFLEIMNCEIMKLQSLVAEVKNKVGKKNE